MRLTKHECSALVAGLCLIGMGIGLGVAMAVHWAQRWWGAGQ